MSAEDRWRERRAIIRSGENALAGTILRVDCEDETFLFQFQPDVMPTVGPSWLPMDDWTPEYESGVLPTLPGSVIINATIRGVPGCMAMLTEDADSRPWMTVQGTWAAPEHITEWTVAEVREAEGQ